MKKYMYELNVYDPGEDYIHFAGFFTSLPLVRKRVEEMKVDPENARCYRHLLNPEGEYLEVGVDIFRK